MRKITLSTLCLFAALSFSACDSGTQAPETFSSAQLLSAKYDITLAEGVAISLNYRSGTPATTSHMLSWEDYTGSAAPDYKTFDLDFDSTHQLFVVNILDSSEASAGAFYIPADRVNVTLKNGTVLHQFSNSLTDIVSVDFSIDATPPATVTFGNCEVRTTRALNLSLTADTMELSVDAKKQWVDLVAHMGGPIDSCSDRLNQEKTYLEMMSPMGDLDLAALKEKNFIDMSRITQLDSLDVAFALSGSLPEGGMSMQFGGDASVAPASALVTVDLGGGASAKVIDPSRAGLL